MFLPKGGCNYFAVFFTLYLLAQARLCKQLLRGLIEQRNRTAERYACYAADSILILYRRCAP